MQRTLAIIKPDCFDNRSGILDRINKEGFRIVRYNIVKWTKDESKRFYTNLKGKDCYEHWTDFMCSGHMMILILERDNAISHWRDVMGATDPENVKEDTIRKQYGVPMKKWNTEKGRNCVHGSDSEETAEIEIKICCKE